MHVFCVKRVKVGMFCRIKMLLKEFYAKITYKRFSYFILSIFAGLELIDSHTFATTETNEFYHQASAICLSVSKTLVVLKGRSEYIYFRDFLLEYKKEVKG